MYSLFYKLLNYVFCFILIILNFLFLFPVKLFLKFLVGFFLDLKYAFYFIISYFSSQSWLFIFFTNIFFFFIFPPLFYIYLVILFSFHFLKYFFIFFILLLVEFSKCIAFCKLNTSFVEAIILQIVCL